MQDFLSKAEQFCNLLKEIEIKLCMLITEHDVSITVADHLTELVKPIHHSVNQLTCDHTKCTSIIRNVIGKFSFQELVTEMREKMFSILLDESTDVSEHKSLAIAVRLVRDGKDRFEVCDEFLGLLPVEDATSEALYEITTKFFTDNNIPYKTNMIALATDNANIWQALKLLSLCGSRKEYPIYFLLLVNVTLLRSAPTMLVKEGYLQR